MKAQMCWVTEPDELVALTRECLPDDTDRAGRFVPQERFHRLAAYGLLRRILRNTGTAPFDCKIERLPTGKPVLSQLSEVSISLSHSALGVMVGIGHNVDVGVDIQEQQDVRIWSDIAAYFAPDENLDCEGFLRRWAASEACAKSHGLGMPAVADAPLKMSDSGCCNGFVWQGRAPRDIRSKLVPGGCVAYAVSAGAVVSVGLS